MGITRIQAETELISRAGGKMSLVGMAVTTDGSNADLNSPLATALRKLGYTVSATVNDDDLSVLLTAELDEFFDRAELRLLQNIQGNFNFSNLDLGHRREDFRELISQIDARIKALRDLVMTEYGEGAATMSGGYVALDFEQKRSDEVDSD